MAKLIAHNPPTAKLKSSGFMGEPTGTLDITENGRYNVKPYAQANVNIPLPEGEITITKNGEYDIYDAATANVDVQSDLAEKTVTENGTYIAADENLDGYSKFTVDVAMGIDDLVSVIVNASIKGGATA